VPVGVVRDGGEALGDRREVAVGDGEGSRRGVVLVAGHTQRPLEVGKVFVRLAIGKAPLSRLERDADRALERGQAPREGLHRHLGGGPSLLHLRQPLRRGIGVVPLERATDTANPRSLSQLLGSLEQLKAIAWGRLLATAAPPERTPAEPLDELRHLTPVEVAELLNLKEAYVHELCRSRQLPATKQGKYWIIPVAELREWLSQSRRGRIDLSQAGSLPLPDRLGILVPGTDLATKPPTGTEGRRRGRGSRQLHHRWRDLRQ
jgi:excisionase family DNA binding protein